MAVGAGAPRALSDPVDAGAGHRRGRLGRTVPVLLLCQSVALLGQAVAVVLARSGDTGAGLTLSFLSFALTATSAVAVLVRPRLTRAARNCAVVCLGLTTTLQWRATDPLLFTGFDEQLHVRTLTDIRTAHELFHPHPLLAVSPHYPGIEALTALGLQAGLPMMAAATAVVLVARLVLVLALCDAVEQVTGSPRAGALAVVLYSVSPQFVFFNSQFSYQTLALPLALTAIALIGRARHSPQGRLLMAGALTCLLAVAVTHHITSLLTAAFVVLWAAVSRGGQAVRRTRLAAVVAVGATATWALVQWTLLRDYFGPIINDVVGQVSGGSATRRQAFSDPSGYVTPPWERVTLAFYAVALTLITAAAVLAGLWSVRSHRPTQHAKPGMVERTPQLLVIVLAAVLPVLFAIRFVPSGGEFGDRATSFVFLPFALLVAAQLVRAARWPRFRRRRRLVQVSAPVLVAVLFIGGYLLGGGPDWQRLPGAYLASADARSMDSETLAAVRWAAEDLPPGTRIGADRVSADLLSGQARIWPVFRNDELDAASLYFADQWGQPQTELARGLRLQYLYVDQRLAGSLPHVGSYFYRGETDGPVRLTAAQLVKFETVPGVRVAYRHGPVTIYDLTGLGVPVERTGWTGERTPLPVLVQLLVGVALGGTGIGLARSPAAPVIGRTVRHYHALAGPSLVFGSTVAALVVVAVVALLAHVWLTPSTCAVAAAIVLVAARRPVGRALHAAVDAIPRPAPREAALLLAAAALAIAAMTIAVASAYAADVTAVERILADPTTVREALP